MKLIQKQVDKLREGKATLVADHSKPEMMDKVLKKAFPEDTETVIEYDAWEYFYRDSDYITDWIMCHNYTIGELIPLDDFFEKEEKEWTTHRVKINMPATSEERDEIVKELLAIDYKAKLPTELDEFKTYSLTVKEGTFISLLRMRDTYRQGLEIYKCEVEICFGKIFSFQDKETAELFLKNFKEELEQVKHLIS